MKKSHGLLVFLTVVALSCTPPDAALERNYQLDPTHTLRLDTPEGQEILIGDQLDLGNLVEVTDQNGQSVSVPVQAVQVFVNDQSVSGSQFQATTVGSYTFTVKIGDRTSNAFTITVLPYKLVRIPVIFHTVNSTLTEAQISRMIQGMTDAFRNKWNPYNGAKDERAVDNFVEFYAAETNPTGQTLTTRGLDAVTSSRATFTSQQAVYEAWNNYWNPNRFLNVWVYDISREESLSGFAYNLPVTQASAGFRLQSVSRSSPDLPYGVYLNQSDVNDSRSTTLAHEAGHVLGLNHIFDGNGDESNACSSVDPDYCADTPFYDRAAYMDNYRTLRQRRTACDGTTFVSTNIMDYYLGYENSFTRDQRDRIQHTLNYGRWLPSPANNDPRARQSAGADFVQKPDDYVFIPPVICVKE